MMTLLLWLVQILGFKRLTKWAAMLITALFWIAVLIVGLVLYHYLPALTTLAAVTIAVIACAVYLIRWLLSRRSAEPEPVAERTIDGKVVPETLAVAALDVPPQSPDGDYVLRGLPDYAKKLMKLDGPEFEFVPEPDPPAPLPADPAPPDLPRRHVPAWQIALAGGAALLIIAGMVVYKTHERPAPEFQFPSRQTKPEPVAAASDAAAPQSPAPAPAPVPSEPDPAQKPADDNLARKLDELQQTVNKMQHPEPQPAIWQDTATGLMWATRSDAGGSGGIPGHEDGSAPGGDTYCKGVTTGGFSDWRYPGVLEWMTWQNNGYKRHGRSGCPCVRGEMKTH